MIQTFLKRATRGLRYLFFDPLMGLFTTGMLAFVEMDLVLCKRV